MSPFPSIELLTNAVEAQYIHEISVRHRSRDPEPRSRGDARPSAATTRSRRPFQRLKLPERNLATAGQPG